MNPVNASVGATVAGVVLLLVMVPILDDLTRTSTDPLVDEEDYIYYKAAPDLTENTYYAISPDGITGFRVNLVDTTTSTSTVIGQIDTPVAGSNTTPICAFSDNGFIAMYTSSTTTDIFGSNYGNVEPSSEVTTPTAWLGNRRLPSDTSVTRIYQNDTGFYIDYVNAQGTNGYQVNIGTKIFIPCDENEAEYVAGHSLKSLMQLDSDLVIVNKYADTTASQYDYAITWIQEANKISGGTYTWTDDNKGFNDTGTMYLIPYSLTSANNTVSYDVTEKGDTYRIENITATGNIYGRSTTLYDYVIITPYDQTIDSEYRDIVMIIPVLVAVAILMNVGMMLVYRRN